MYNQSAQYYVKKNNPYLPDLETERLKFQKLDITDQNDYYEYGSKDIVTKYVLWETFETLNDTIRYIKTIKRLYKKRTYGEWAIHEKKTGKMIGTCGFTIFSKYDMSAEIGFSFNPEYWNNGYCTEAVIEVINYAKNVLHLQYLTAETVKENTSSNRVLQKCGFILENSDQIMNIKGVNYSINHYKIAFC